VDWVVKVRSEVKIGKWSEDEDAEADVNEDEDDDLDWVE
jgi:hypothetical protein